MGPALPRLARFGSVRFRSAWLKLASLRSALLKPALLKLALLKLALLGPAPLGPALLRPARPKPASLRLAPLEPALGAWASQTLAAPKTGRTPLNPLAGPHPSARSARSAPLGLSVLSGLSPTGLGGRDWRIPPSICSEMAANPPRIGESL